jgi:hypothetical protein
MILAELTDDELDELPILWDILQRKLAAGDTIIAHWSHWEFANGESQGGRSAPVSKFRHNKNELVVDTAAYDVYMQIDSLPYWKLVKGEGVARLWNLYLKPKP